MNKLYTLTLATACAAAMLAQPVLSQSIVVSPEVSEQQFVESVSKDLNTKLRQASRWNEPVGEGITIVRFTRASDGEPDNVRLYRRSGKHNLDRTAMRAVRRLDSLDAVPRGVGRDQIYQANIIFANDGYGFAKLQEQLDAEETARMAAEGGTGKVLAFGIVADGPSS